MRNESIHVKVDCRKRASDTPIEDIDARMEVDEETADDEVTISAGRALAEHGDASMGEATVGEGCAPTGWMILL